MLLAWVSLDGDESLEGVPAYVSLDGDGSLEDSSLSSQKYLTLGDDPVWAMAFCLCHLCGMKWFGMFCSHL